MDPKNFKPDFRIVDIQASLFLKNILFPSDISIFANDLSDAVSKLDGIPTIIPITSDAPPEIPRLILKNIDESYACQISNIRADLVLSNKSREGEIKLFRKLEPTINSLTKFLFSKKVKIRRIALIIRIEFTAPKKMSNAEYLKSIFTQGLSKIEPRELELRFIYRSKIIKIDSNISTTIKQKGSGIRLDKDIILLQFDINTAPEIMGKSQFSQKQISDFCAEAFTIIQSKIGKFPAI